MHIDIKGILTGIKNSIFVKDEIEKLAKERLLICGTCPHYSPNAKTLGIRIVRKDNFCMDCGCNLYLKTRDPSQFCPLGKPKSKFPMELSKWGPEATVEEAQKMMDTKDLQDQLNEYKLKLMRNQIEE